jgi:hypothetical protein
MRGAAESELMVNTEKDRENSGLKSGICIKFLIEGSIEPNLGWTLSKKVAFTPCEIDRA